MKLLIALLLISSVAFGQLRPLQPSDTLNTISYKEVMDFMKRIDFVVRKNLDRTQDNEYANIVKVLNEIIAEADKKRRK